MLIVLFVVGLSVLRELGVEAINVILEDVKILEIDREYFDPEKCEAHIDEDEESAETSLAIDLSLIKTIPPGTNYRLAVKKFSMGRYMIPTGINITRDLCEAIENSPIVGPFFAGLGWTKDECPPLPGIYSQKGYQPPLERLPDQFLESKYVGYINFFAKKKTLISFAVYVFIQDDY